MFETFRNAWKVEELRKRILYTLLILVIFRLGCAVPVPYVDASVLDAWFGTGNMLDYLNMMSGSALSQCTLFALGVSPYINSSIIIQLLTVAIPALERLSKEGEEGRRKLTRITKYASGGIALGMSIGYYFVLRNLGALSVTGWQAWFVAVVIILCFTAGAQLATFLGEQVDSKGIGNGVSLLIFTGIIANWSNVVTAVNSILTKAATQPLYYLAFPGVIILALAAVVFVVILTNAERRLPVQYAKRVVGRKMYGGQSSHIPIKVNMSGVMPVIFASALCSIPGTIGGFINLDAAAHPYWTAFFNFFSARGWGYMVFYLLLIIGFNYFYVLYVYLLQSAPEQRRDPRLPSRQADQRFHHQGTGQDHPGGRPVPGRGRRAAHSAGQRDRPSHPAGRYQPADRGRRGPGHLPQHGKLHGDASPQGLPAVN